MHDSDVSKEVADRVIARRGRYHLFDAIDASRAALVVIDMQPTFVAEGSPAEVPASRGIVGNINEFAAALRERGGTVIWVVHANQPVGEGGSDWDGFFNRFVSDEVRTRTIQSLRPEAPGQKLWPELEPGEGDVFIIKNRYSALIPGSSPLERMLRSRGFRSLFIAGTKTNICCETTARDAMMMDFDVVMLRDCCAALSEREHQAALENIIQQFGDVMTREEAPAALDRFGTRNVAEGAV